MLAPHSEGWPGEERLLRLGLESLRLWREGGFLDGLPAAVVTARESLVVAVDRADAAYQDWSQRSYAERGEILNRFADLFEARQEELAEIVGHEMGKPKPQTIAATWVSNSGSGKTPASWKKISRSWRAA